MIFYGIEKDEGQKIEVEMERGALGVPRECTDGAGLGSVCRRRRTLLGCRDREWDWRLRSAVARWVAPRCAVAAALSSVVLLSAGLHMRVGSFWTRTEILLSHSEPRDRSKMRQRCAACELGLREKVSAMFDLLRAVQPSCWGFSPHSACREAVPVLHEHFGTLGNTVLSCRFRGDGDAIRPRGTEDCDVWCHAEGEIRLSFFGHADHGDDGLTARRYGYCCAPVVRCIWAGQVG